MKCTVKFKGMVVESFRSIFSAFASDDAEAEGAASDAEEASAALSVSVSASDNDELPAPKRPFSFPNEGVLKI